MPDYLQPKKMIVWNYWLMSISKISEMESLLITKRAKIVELKSQVENMDILINKQQMEIECYKKELADDQSH